MSTTRKHPTQAAARCWLLLILLLAAVPAHAFKMESASVTLNDTFTTPSFTSVSFRQTYDTVPLVFALPSNEGSDPSALRIQNVTTTGFQISHVEPPGNDGPHIAMTIHYIAIEPGVHYLPDGTRIEASTLSTTTVQHGSGVGGGEGWDNVSFTAGFAGTPAVLGQIQGLANEQNAIPGIFSVPWLTTAIRNVTSSSAQMALERSEANDGGGGAVSSNETIAYLAMEAAQGSFTDNASNTISYEALVSADNITGWGNCIAANFNGSYSSAPLVVATKNRHDGGDGGWLRRCSLSTASIGLTVDEDMDRDSERNHTTENAGIVVLSQAFDASFPDPTALTYYEMDETSWNGTAGEVVDEQGANNGTAVGSATTSGLSPAIAGNPGTCRYGEIPFNNSSGTQDAVDTGIDLNTIGNRGSISFWYKSNADWNGSNGDRQILDASTTADGQKYFFLVLRNNSRLRFGLEDSIDADFTLDTGNNSFNAGTWVHIAITWDLPGDRMEIYLNGSSAARYTSNDINTNGSLGNLDTLFFGDNRSTYLVLGATGNSANGSIDEPRIYSTVLTPTQITTDMNATHGCGTAGVLDRFDILVPAYASECDAGAAEITIIARDGLNNVLTDYTGLITLSTSNSLGDWSTITANGSLNNGAANDGAATYQFVDDGDGINDDDGIVVLELDLDTDDTLTVTVQDISAGVSSTSSSIDFRRDNRSFIITNDTVQVAGRAQAMTITKLDNSCATDTGYNGLKNMRAWITRDLDDPGGAAPSINGVSLPNSDPGGNNLTGGNRPNFNNGVASINLDTTDVGKYRLNLREGGRRGSSDSITTRPFGFAFTSIQAGATSNPGASTPGGSIFTSAGSNFQATVTAVTHAASLDTNDDGIPDTNTVLSAASPTVSFAWPISLDASLNTPPAAVGGTAGAFTFDSNDTTQASFASGVTTVNPMTYAEVGSMRIAATLASYLNTPGSGVTNTSAIVGRFTPADFNVVLTTADGSGSPTFDAACTAFTYMDQGLAYTTNAAPVLTLTARSSTGSTTQNYNDFTGSGGQNWWLLADINLTYSDAGMSAGVSIDSASATQALNSDTPTGGGTFTETLTGPLAYQRPAGSAADPFDSNMGISFSVTDSDGISYGANPFSFSIDFATGNNAAQRHGRLQLDNGLGSELATLAMTLQAQYYNGANDGFIANPDEDGACTSITTADVLLYNNEDPKTGRAVGNTSIVVNSSGVSRSTTLTDVSPFNNGTATLSFSAPCAATCSDGDGYVNVEVQTSTSLLYDLDGIDQGTQGPGGHCDPGLGVSDPGYIAGCSADSNSDDDVPAARGTFGIFDGNSTTIFMQEL